MKKIYAITVSVFILIVASIIFQFLKSYFSTLQLSGAMLFITETIKILPLIFGVLLVKFSWKRILND